MIRGFLCRLDVPLLLGALGLAAYGLVLVFAATAHRPDLTGGDATIFLRRQAIDVAAGIAVFALVSAARPASLRAWVPFFYLACVSGLVAVLFVGTTVNGARAWIHLPLGISLQPAEFAKLGVVTAMAYVLAARCEHAGRETPNLPDSLCALGVLLVPLVLIGLQPDVGTALVLSVTAAAVLVVAGVRLRWLLGLAVGSAALAAVAISSGLLASYQVARLTTFLRPTADPNGAGYNTNQARIAIASGGLTGEGLLQGQRTNGGFVPEQHTDFVFTVAGEELGFLGSALLIGLLALVLWRGLRIASETGDLYGRLVATGIVSWLAIQAFENIGMTLGLTPVTGVPLPLVSYGGSSVVAGLTAIGLLQTVRLRNP